MGTTERRILACNRHHRTRDSSACAKRSSNHPRTMIRACFLGVAGPSPLFVSGDGTKCNSLTYHKFVYDKCVPLIFRHHETNDVVFKKKKKDDAPRRRGKSTTDFYEPRTHDGSMVMASLVS